MRKITRGLATAAVAAALIAGPAAAASAYTPTAPAAGSLTVIAGNTINVNFSGFAPNATVVFVLSGGTNAGGATLASTATTTKTSNSVGDVTVAATLPSNAAGTYTLTGTDEFGNTVSAEITVTAADSAATDGLANTGSDSAAAFWFAGGLLALGATTVVTLNVVRRNRAQA